MSAGEKHSGHFDPERYKPEAGLWEKIEEGLDAAGSAIPESAFSTFSPAADTWSKIEAGLDAAQAGFGWRKIASVAAAVILLVGITWFITNDYGFTGKKGEESGNAVKQNVHSLTFVKDTSHTEEIVAADMPEPPSAKQARKPDTVVVISPIPPPSPGNPDDVKAKREVENNISQSNTPAYSVPDISLSGNYLAHSNPRIGTISRITIQNRSVGKLSPHAISGRQKNWLKHLFAGISYEKELYSLGYSYVKERESQSIGLSAGYKWKSAFVKTALDFQKVKDAGFFEITYLQNEVVGSELRVDSVIYEYNSEHQLLRKYVTSEVEIYDSIEHTVQEKPLNEYAYLRIPFAAGYRFRLSKITVSASLGTELSILLQGKEPVPVLDGEDFHITKVIRKSPFSKKTAWQVIFSGGVYYPLGNALMLGTEIIYRSDLNQVYSLGNKEFIRPYSWSIRAGLKYNF